MRIASESLCSGTVLLPAMLPGRGYSLPMLLRMRASPLRVSGVVPMRASNSVSSIASHASASIASGSNTGSKAGLVCIGAFWLWGQQLWQRSQPKIQPSRPIPSVGSFSIVWQEIQRPVSITFGATIAPVGQLCQNAAAVVGIPLAHAHVFKAAGHAHPQSQIGIALLPVRLPVAGDDGLGLLPADSDGLENAHTLLNHLGGQRPVAGRERIAQTNFKGVHAQPFGRLVD